MSDATSTTVQRSLRVDLQLPQEIQDSLPRILSSIRQYRAALRHNYGILVEAHDAAGEIEWTDDNVRVTPANAAARVIAGLATRQATLTRTEPATRVRGAGDTYTVQIGRGAVYELRAELQRQLPTVLSFVIDSARRDIQTAWTARDPEYPRATRGWLTLQGARGSARFARRGIGHPVATARPQLNGYRLVIRWDHEIGTVEFKLGTLDPARRHVWRSIADGDDGWSLGTVFLSERDGKLFATLTYTRPADLRDVDPTRVLGVAILGDDPDTLFRYRGPDGVETFDTIGAAAVRAMLAEHTARRIALEARRGDCGAPRRPWGFRKGWQENQTTLTRHTEIRARLVADYNHAWTRRIVGRATSWRCGVITVGPIPQRSFNGGPPVGSIGLHPWNWTGFRHALEYKARERGIAVTWDGPQQP